MIDMNTFIKNVLHKVKKISFIVVLSFFHSSCSLMVQESSKEFSSDFYKYNILKDETNKKSNVNQIPKKMIELNSTNRLSELKKIVDTYYNSARFNRAQEVIDYTLQIYPKNQNLDYFLYTKGTITMKMNENTLLRFFKTDLSDRDIQYLVRASHIFFKIIKDYPKSKYLKNTFFRLIYIKNSLAYRELKIIKYFYKNKIYDSLINRGKQIIMYYPDTSAAYEAIPYIEKSCKELHRSCQIKQYRTK